MIITLAFTKEEITGLTQQQCQLLHNSNWVRDLLSDVFAEFRNSKKRHEEAEIDQRYTPLGLASQARERKRQAVLNRILIADMIREAAVCGNVRVVKSSVPKDELNERH